MNLVADPQFPTKWPFPPVPPGRRGLGRLGNALSRFRPGHSRAMDAGPAAVPATPAAPAIAGIAGAGTTAEQGVTVRQMVVDVLLVAMWGAMIPGLMWLGAAAGF